MAKAPTEMTAGLVVPGAPAVGPDGKTLPLPRRTFAIISHPDAGKTR